jgi:hypothetical protein
MLSISLIIRTRVFIVFVKTLLKERFYFLLLFLLLALETTLGMKTAPRTAITTAIIPTMAVGNSETVSQWSVTHQLPAKQQCLSPATLPAQFFEQHLTSNEHVCPSI